VQYELTGMCAQRRLPRERKKTDHSRSRIPGKLGRRSPAPLHEVTIDEWLAGLGRGGGGVEVGEDFFGGFAGDYFGESVDASALDVGDAAELAEELAGGGGADAGDVAEGGFGLALGAAEAVEGDGEAMGLVADLLDQVEDRVVAVELDGLVFLAVEVEDLFLFGDAGERLVDDSQRFEGFGGGVELADAAVDQDQAGEGLVFLEDALVAAGDGFAHGGEVVVLSVGGAGVDGDDAGEGDGWCLGRWFDRARDSRLNGICALVLDCIQD
jgi:hypothetical protein